MHSKPTPSHLNKDIYLSKEDKINSNNLSNESVKQKFSQKTSSLEIGRATLALESQALALTSQRLGIEIEQAADIIFKHSGKIIVTGIGKSGLVAQKLASTLASTGTTAIFLHSAEAVHGDLGVYSPGDPTIMISKSGTTVELMRLIPTLREFKSPIIAIVGNTKSPIAQQADVVLDGGVTQEADPLEIVPTASAIVAMGLGDALAAILMVKRGFEKKDFARLHPSGQLGRNLLMRVGDAMHRVKDVAQVKLTDSIREVVIVMTERPLGAAVVQDTQGKLLGLITDGDIRRCLKQYDDIRQLTAQDIMTKDPISIEDNLSIGEAIDIMENRPAQISVLPVVNASTGQALGLFRIHDAYQPHMG